MRILPSRSALRGAFAGIALLAIVGASVSGQDSPPHAASLPMPLPPAAPLPVYQPASALRPDAPQALPELPPVPAVPPVVPAVVPPPADDVPKFNIAWHNGIFIESAEKDFVVHFGGTLHYDAAWYQATPILELGPGGTGHFRDGVNPRRMRLAAEGTLYKQVDFKLEFEFANGNGFAYAGPNAPTQTLSATNSPGPTHAWITVTEVPFVGNVRIGNQKEWFSLEHLNPHKFLEFMERSYLFDFTQLSAFNNGFTPGISVFRTWADDRLFSAIGAYKNESTLIGYGLGDGEYAVTGRVAALPIWKPDERMFWHVGGAMSHRDPVDGKVQIRIRDNVRNAPFPLLNLVANTGLIDTDSQDLFNLETALVWGPLTFQAEYTANVLRGATPLPGIPATTLFFQGYYAEVMYFLTGESRPWNAKNFFFNRVVPKRPLRFTHSECEGRGWGAWEVGVRYTHIDLSNEMVRAGRLDAVTLGLNWYLNANAKLQFNYDLTHRGNTNTPAQGTIHAFGTRMAVDF